MAFAVQLGLSVQHLLTVGEGVRNLGAELTLLEPGHIPPVDASPWLWPVKVLQAITLSAGVWLGSQAVVSQGSPGKRQPVRSAVAALPLLMLFTLSMSVTC